MIKVFTGPNCPGCKPVKAFIENAGLQGKVVLIDVAEQPQEAMKYRIRSVPAAAAPDGNIAVGTSDVLTLLKTI